jgi:glycosyltransferase involved in cell wall biosynthesis
MNVMTFFSSVLRRVRPGVGQLGTYPPRALKLPTLKPNYLSSPPKISVVVPTLNQGPFIGETLQSLVEQKYPNLELIVVDGGSSDCTLTIIKKFERHITWWTSEPDDGQAAAINKGFGKATGDIMAWLNSDDRLVPGALNTIARYFSIYPETNVLYGNRVLIDECGFEIGRWVLPPHSARVLKWADFVPQETLYWRRSAWQAVGCQIDERFRFAMDWDLLLRFSHCQQKIRRIPYFLGLFRIHSAQKTSAEMSTLGKKEMDRIREREIGHLPTRWEIILNTTPYLMLSRGAEVLEWICLQRAQDEFQP